jgi:hypothetical protein
MIDPSRPRRRQNQITLRKDGTAGRKSLTGDNGNRRNEVQSRHERPTLKMNAAATTIFNWTNFFSGESAGTGHDNKLLATSH